MGKNCSPLLIKTAENTLNNLLAYEKPDRNNFVYGLFYWNHPHYSYGALKNIKIEEKERVTFLISVIHPMIQVSLTTH